MSAFHSEDEGSDLSLNLTALMDILSNLLFFLLASYSAQAMEVQQKPDLKLPASSSEVKLTPSLTVTVSRYKILVADVPVAGVEGDRIIGSAIEENDNIVTLFDKLKNLQSTRAAAADGMPGQDVVLLLADKGTDSSIITKVLKTAGRAGFVNVKFGVLAQ